MLFVKSLFSMENPLWPILVKFSHSYFVCWDSEREKERIFNNPSILFLYLNNSLNNFLQKYNFIYIYLLIWIKYLFCIVSVCVCVCCWRKNLQILSHYLKSLWNSILSIKLLRLVSLFSTVLPSLGLYLHSLFPEIRWIYGLSIVTIRHVLGKMKNNNQQNI